MFRKKKNEPEKRRNTSKKRIQNPYMHGTGDLRPFVSGPKMAKAVDFYHIKPQARQQFIQSKIPGIPIGEFRRTAMDRMLPKYGRYRTSDGSPRVVRKGEKGNKVTKFDKQLAHKRFATHWWQGRPQAPQPPPALPPLRFKWEKDYYTGGLFGGGGSSMRKKYYRTYPSSWF
jgi:hypothetical protein